MKNEDEGSRLIQSVKWPAIFLLILWAVQILSFAFWVDLRQLGILPMHVEGLPGLITWPLIHGDFQHLLSNSMPVLILGSMLFYFYPNVSGRVITGIWLLSGILVWLFARNAWHLGASGIIYGMASFIFFSGVFTKNRTAFTLSLVIMFLYGGMIWGVLPMEPGVSWEGHLFGALSGLAMAWLFRNKMRKEHQEQVRRQNRRKYYHHYLEHEEWDYRQEHPPTLIFPEREEEEEEN